MRLIEMIDIALDLEISGRSPDKTARLRGTTSGAATNRPPVPAKGGSHCRSRFDIRGLFNARTVLLGVATISMISVYSMTHARSPERPVILLSCPPGETPLCRAMEQALAQAASGGAIVRIVARGNEAPARPGDLGVALHLDTRQTHSLEGHLEWQTAGDSGHRTGPRVRFDVMDAILSPQMYAQFAQGLIQADTAMQGTLAP